MQRGRRGETYGGLGGHECQAGGTAGRGAQGGSSDALGSRGGTNIGAPLCCDPRMRLPRRQCHPAIPPGHFSPDTPHSVTAQLPSSVSPSVPMTVPDPPPSELSAPTQSPQRQTFQARPSFHAPSGRVRPEALSLHSSQIRHACRR